jgi:CRP-like cAMP-binding protein
MQITEVERFFSTYPKRSFRKGQILLLNGDTAESVHFIVDGRVKQYDVSYRGDELVLNRFKSGAFFPMSLVMNPMPSPYIFEAETNIVVHTAPAKEVLKFLASHPDVVMDLLGRVYRGADGLLGRMVQLMGGNARSRLAYELVLEAKRFGKKLESGGILLETHEHTIGEQSGMSRETVSREVHKLKREGLIKVSMGGILISDIDELEKLTSM